MDSEQQKAARSLAAFDVSAMGREDSVERAAPANNPVLSSSSLALSQAESMRYRDTPVDNYLIGRNLIADSGHKQTLFQTTAGRVITRVGTRGICGAMAFTWAQGYAGRAMRNYNPQSIESFAEWRKALLNVSAVPDEAFVNKPNTMQAIAKAYDYVAGKPIQAAAKMFAPHANLEREWADKSVLFRQRTMHRDPVSTYKNISTTLPDGGNPFKQRNNGRSVGAEVVSVTADFAAASFADALARNIVDTIDPNNTKARKAWQDEQGHFSPVNFAGDWGKRLWRVATFNMGEDWAVALPYVYFIKWHRNVIDHFSPGFKLASDNPSWQAASDKLKLTNDNGHLKLETIGDFQKEGAWDLQARFVMYNVFTLMFRESYTKVGNAISNWWKGDQWLPPMHMPDNPVVSAIETVGDTARYSAKSFIKANLYMQPAVPFFWAFRTSQSKWQSSPIVTEGVDAPVILTKMSNDRGTIHADLASKSPNLKYQKVANDYVANRLSGKFVGHRSADDHVRLHMWKDHGGQPVVWVNQTPIYDHPYKQSWRMFDDGTTDTLFTAFTKPLGRLSFNTGSAINHLVQKSPTASKITSRIFGQSTQHFAPDGKMQDISPEALKWQTEKSIRTAVDASLSYTPYMIAKAETAMRWDNPDMDKAAYRLIDGVMSFNISEVKKAISEISDLLVHPRVRDENKDDPKEIPSSRIEVANLNHEPMAAKQRTLH